MDFNLRIPHVDEIKAHFRKHEKEYTIGGTVVVTAGVTYLLTRRMGVQTITITPIFVNQPMPLAQI